MGMISRNPMMMSFIKLKSNPSEENFKALQKTMSGSQLVTDGSTASPAAQATSNTTSPMSRRRARSLEKQSQLNNKTTLLGG
jgi:hypothetical protein